MTTKPSLLDVAASDPAQLLWLPALPLLLGLAALGVILVAVLCDPTDGAVEAARQWWRAT